MNNNWYSIAGNWLGLGGSITGTGGYGWYNASSNYNAWTTAPMTAHILWTRPEGFGGTVGGEIGGSETGNYWSERQYERMFQPIIMQGILYYEIYPGSTQNPQGWTAVNLQTGKTLYTQTSPVSATGTQMILRCGQILNYLSPNAFGARPYLWTVGTPAGVNVATGTTTMNLVEPSTGNYILSVVNGTSIQFTEDAGGNLIGYFINSTAGTQIINGVPVVTPPGGAMLEAWNSTQCIIAGTDGAAAWEWYPYQNAQISFKLGIMWAMPIATNLSGVSFPVSLGISSINSGVVIMTAFGSAGGTSYTSGFEIAAGDDANTGVQLWLTNRTETPFTKLDGSGENSYLLNGNGVYVETNQNTYTENGYSDTTGTLLWSTVLPNPNTYDVYLTNAFVANNVIYLFGMGGDIYALNIQTGTVIWHQTTTAILGPAGDNTPYGIWPIWTQAEPVTIANGVLYFPTGHEYSPPIFRGAQEICLNITNGQPIWNELGFFVDSPAAISDGVLTTVNGYDNQIYGFGMGPSETTVTAPDIGATTATPVTVRGEVMDISAGSQQEAIAANFHNGLPCVSDSSMSQWMAFVYQQQPEPTNTTGVPVQISVLDSNGNHYPIGTTTTDSSGSYSITWTPSISGNFTVFATFEGTQSYYGSSAETNLYVSNAQTSTSTPAPLTANYATTNDFMLGVAAIIAVIVVIGAIIIVLMLRKRP